MDDVTQQNAALVEQAAAESLEDQVAQLVQVVTRFTLEESAQPRKAAVEKKMRPIDAAQPRIASKKTSRPPVAKKQNRLGSLALAAPGGAAVDDDWKEF